jgi:opacity protein-like surface antigen
MYFIVLKYRFLIIVNRSIISYLLYFSIQVVFVVKILELIGVYVQFFKKKIIVFVGLAISYPSAVLSGPSDDAPVQTQTQSADSPVQTQGDNNISSGTKSQSVISVPLPSQYPTDPLKTGIYPKTKPARQGIRFGSFMVSPEISVTGMYDENIFATRTGEVEDFVTTVTPAVSIKSDWTKHSLNFWAGVSGDMYRSNPDQNVVDHWLETEGRYDISNKTNIYAGLGLSRNHEDRANLDDPLRAFLAAEPTRYWETNGHLGVFHQFDAVSVRLGTTYEHLNFDDVPNLGGGTINMDDRDRKQYSTGGRISYKVSPKYVAFAQAATDNRRYDESSIGRDSDGYSVAAGMGVDFGGNNRAEAYIGHMKQNYKNSAMADVSKPYFGAEAQFATGPNTYVSAHLDRDIDETTITGASSSLDTTVWGRVDHDVSQNLSFNGRLSYSRSKYQGVDRKEHYFGAGFGAKYFLTKDVYLAGDYQILMRETNVDTVVVNGNQDAFDFAKSQIFVSLGYAPGSLPRPVVNAGLPGIHLAALDVDGLGFNIEPDYAGFYAGAQTGYGNLASEVHSRRADGSTDEMNLGKIGGQNYGLFAGYGQMWNRWYYGAEIEVEGSDASWDHSKGKADARTMSADKNESYGLGVRLGYALNSGLLYGGYGLVRTNFDTFDTENQFAAAGAYDKDKDVTGNRYSLGMDIPASQNLFVRMNYSYTDYDSYDATSFANATGTALTVDRIANNESLFRVGLGWRFGNRAEQRPQVDAAIARGFYVGAKLGYGAVGSDLDAIHNDGGGAPCVNCAFTGDFSDNGFTGGFFAGYGTTINRVYLGLELEADAANAEWENDRDSGGGGRDFSVSKKGSHGASVKLGYVLNNGALLYARAGQVRTRFNTIYNKGNVNNWVDRDDTLTGDRLGFGAEVPAYRNVFVKMDYTVTDYDDYSFTTQHANADTENFDNKESLFSLGLGLRF